MRDGAKLANLVRTARLLGVPVAWLKAEAIGGRVPCIRAGRMFLFNPEAVEQELSQRAAESRVPSREVAHVA